jgi:hypothetical protein
MTQTEGAALVAPDESELWPEKVQKAKEARESAKAQREGKSPVFPMNWSLLPATQ